MCCQEVAALNEKFDKLAVKCRSSLPEVFCKKDVLGNFAKFTGKHLCQSLFFNKVAGGACNFIKKETLTQVFSCEFCEISKNTFSQRTPLVAASVKCITEAEEFRTLCINKAVLDNVLTGLHDSRGDYLEKITSNRSYCYATYKQFTWWAYKRLGKGNRRVIPSRALWVIWNMYPELDNYYTLYNEGEKD